MMPHEYQRPNVTPITGRGDEFITRLNSYTARLEARNREIRDRLDEMINSDPRLKSYHQTFRRPGDDS
jgi:hypothetical protein